MREPRTSNIAPPRSNLEPRTCAFAFAVLALLVALAYGNSLRNGFALDDRILIVENKLLTSPAGLAALLLDDYWLARLSPYGDPPFFSGLYRPMTVASYAFNYFIGGLQPLGYHLVNVLLHLIVSVLVYLVARQLQFVREAALAAAGLFAVHPIHTEVVSNVAGRAELLMAMGVLGSLWFAARRERNLSLGAFALGLLSKEQALMLPFLLVLFDFCSRGRFLNSPDHQITRSVNQRIHRFASRYGWYVVVLLLYLLLRGYALGGRLIAHTGFLENPAAYADFWTRLLTALKVAGVYLWLCVWPVALSADYSYDAIPVPLSLLDWQVLAGLLSWGGLLVAAAWSYRRGDRRVTFAIGLAVITFAPVSNVIISIGTLMGERLFYLPSAGLCLLAGLAYERLRLRFRLRQESSPNLNLSLNLNLLHALLLLLCLAMVARTVVRNRDWVSNEAIFRSAVRVVPNSAKAHAALGDELKDRSSRAERLEAVEDYQTALRIYPDYLFKDPKLAENLVRLQAEIAADGGKASDE